MIDILYADDAIVVATKPHDLLSVPGRGPENQDCMLSRLQQDFPTIRVVHRLDCATSGVMVFGLTADSHRELSRQFHDRETGKRYIAEVFGAVASAAGEVNLPLRCDWENRPRQIVDPEQGKHALTQWQVISKDERSSRVALTPVTGRSHQLRVHMQQMGHPILGDRFYAHPDALKAAPRLLLHAEQLEVTHPISKQRMLFQADCPF